ncbi:MFS transporter [Anabaena sp. UHCC 0204]|uniref:MFS transporter n=1 Tax=Anabaena sp. UHCC 0204 TaxID=2590009 RepID=UPI001447D527|nr:MFS transporter [Anabaena sp. UHCC 0204]MTJ09472.1 MFS transporter [Anabaena sp. UHCC 0204]
MLDDNDGFKHTPTSEKLDFKTKLAYGVGTLGQSMTGNIGVIFMLLFFTNVAGIPAGLAGSILMIGKIWDAINDPMVGWLTDNTKSRRWGRRLPWLLYGAIPFAISRFLLWVVPQFSANQSSNIWLLFWYYVVIGVISEALFTVVNLPYAAMTPELTQDYDERTNLNSFRFTFSISGDILSLVLAIIIFSQIADPQQQYLVLAGICSLVAVISLYLCVYGTRDRILSFEKERNQQEEPEKIPLLEQLTTIWTNKPFLFVISIFLCSWLGANVTASILPYFIIYCMGLQNSDVPLVMIVVQVTALFMLFVWSHLSKKIGKKMVYLLGVSLWIIATGGLFFVQPQQIWLMYIIAMIAGVGLSTAYLIPASMIPDVIDLDELQTGQRREGIYYGFMVLLQKFGLAFGLFLVGNVLQALGFNPSVAGQISTQPDSALLAIRIVVSPVTIFFLSLGLILNYFYPLTRDIHTEIMLKLKERRQEIG